MPNKIFQTILNRKIESFVLSFINDSESIFYREGQLIHPGEFGKYRESTLKELLRVLINSNLSISDGFIITSKENVSTQCDIVVYDSTDIPFLSNGIAQFFTIESVVSIGEIKSTLSKNQFKEAIIKLAKNKSLRAEMDGTLKQKKYDFREHDHIVSFLVCRKLDFNLQEIDFAALYGDVEQKFWHNAILSLEDGLFLYSMKFSEFEEPMKANFISKGGNIDESVLWEYPIHQENDLVYKCKSEYIPINADKQYHHITFFIHAVVRCIKDTNLFNSEFIKYADLPHTKLFN
ncbi:MAG TPA: DUF6602 domain-containing protein [Flavisolibacter sp.]|nr:DUF6602 domain-containing protein [Flavisolibacter sp.]